MVAVAVAMVGGLRLGEGGAAPQSFAAVDPPMAITDVTAFTQPGATIEGATIVIADGRIVAVGVDVTIPADAVLVDGKGLIAYPGFIDAHAHLGVSEDERTEADRTRIEDENPDPRQGPLPATRFANRRGIRPELRAVDLYNPEEKSLDAYRQSGFTAALIAPRDGIFSGSSDVLMLGDAPIRRSVLADNVAMHGSFSTGEDGSYPLTLLGVFAQFRQVMLDTARSVKVRKFTQRHPRSARRAPVDAALEALEPVLRRAQPLVFEANSENEIRRALDLTKEFNLRIVISGAKEAWKVADRIRDEHIPLIVSVKFDEEPEYGKNLKGKKRRGDARKVSNELQSEDKAGEDKKDEKKIYQPLKVRKELPRLWEEQVSNAVRLHEAGIPFALRTRDFDKPSELFDNLRMVIERGLPEDVAVAALTVNAASIFGVEDQIGSMTRGRIANITLMTKPITDKESKVRYVVVDGKKFEFPEDEESNGKKGGDKDGKADAGDQVVDKDDETGASDESSGDESPERDAGPTFASEIKADRIPKTKTGGNVLIQNATIIPVTGPTLDHASILIRDGKIEAIGQILEVPEGVTVIDGQGRFIIPGFVDCHSHLGLSGVNEWALAISAEVRIGDLIDPTSVGIFRAAAGGTTTHHVMHGSANPIGGQNAIVKTKYGRSAAEMLLTDAPRTIKFALGENVKQSNRPMAWGKRFPNTRMGVEAVIRSALQAGKAYQAQWEDYEVRTRAGEDVVPPRRDLRLDAMRDILTGELTVHSHCYRSDEILRLLATAEDYGFRIGTLQHVLEGYRIAPEIARHGSGASTFSNFWAYKLEAYGAIPYNAALMTDHGINVSINSDSPNTIRYFGQEAAKSIKWGNLTENETLRLVTINPAMQLLIDDRVGSLEVGKDGDLAIFNGHPLNTFSKCIMTVIDGEVFFEDLRPEPTEPAGMLNLRHATNMTIPATEHRAYAITGATVHPISAPPMENATVVIIEDRIHAVGTDVVIPPGAGVIDASGMHVYPGLIDAGGSLGLGEIGSIRASQDSSDIAKFAPHLRAASAVHSHSELMRVARTAGITTALTKPSAGGRRRGGSAVQIAGRSAVIRLDGWTAPEMLIVDDYALHMTVPSLPERMPKETRKQRTKDHTDAMRELNEFMEQAKHYAKVKALAKTDADVDFEINLVLDSMVPYVRGEKPVVFGAGGYKQMLETIEFAEKHELRPILGGATESWKLADILAEKDIPVILGTPLSYPRGRFEPWDAVYRCAGVLDRAGVRFCFASESASGAYNLGIQAGMAVAHGLSREKAEYALTLGAAKILGIDDRVGSIEVGKLADLIVTTDTPLQTVSQVSHMFIAGKPIELTSMHTESYKKFKNRPEPKLPPLGELNGPPSLTGR